MDNEYIVLQAKNGPWGENYYTIHDKEFDYYVKRFNIPKKESSFYAPENELFLCFCCPIPIQRKYLNKHYKTQLHKDNLLVRRNESIDSMERNNNYIDYTDEHRERALAYHNNLMTKDKLSYQELGKMDKFSRHFYIKGPLVDQTTLILNDTKIQTVILHSPFEDIDDVEI